LPALRAAVEASRDPYIAVAALRSVIAIAGSEELLDWLEQLAHNASFMVRAVAQQALASSSRDTSADSKPPGGYTDRRR
jgi:hypothetical protein